MEFNPDKKPIEPESNFGTFLAGLFALFIVGCIALMVAALTIKVLRWAL